MKKNLKSSFDNNNPNPLHCVKNVIFLYSDKK